LGGLGWVGLGLTFSKFTQNTQKTQETQTHKN